MACGLKKKTHEIGSSSDRKFHYGPPTFKLLVLYRATSAHDIVLRTRTTLAPNA